MNVIDVDSDTASLSPPPLIINHTTNPFQLVMSENITNVDVSQTGNPPFDVSAEVMPDPQAHDRLMALQELYQQKQADLIASFQQAQMNLASQMNLYFQQAIAKQRAEHGQPDLISHASSIENVHTYSGEDRRTVPESVARLVAARSQPSLQSHMTHKLAATLQQHQHINHGMPAPMPHSRPVVSTMSVGNIGAASHSAMLNANMRCISSSGAISDRTRERLRAVLFQKQTQKSQNNLNSLGGSQPLHAIKTMSPGVRRESQDERNTATGDLSHVLSEFQLRKVSSEPNLKMRPLPRNRPTRSPPYTIPSNHRLMSSQSNVSSAFKPPTLNPSRFPDNTFRGANPLSFPSPSLPNLPVRDHGSDFQDPTETGQNVLPPGVDLYSVSQMLAQQGFGAHQLLMSMPSLFTSNAFNMSMPNNNNHITNVLNYSNADRLRASLDPRLSLSGSICSSRDSAAIGRKSLLKQQLRDLVLRRKSLVREETEDELSHVRSNLNLLAAAALNSNKPLKTGIAYDAGMCKHICVCKDNKQHVEHGGRTHSIFARLMETGLLDACERIVARKASLEQLKLVHSETYVTFFAISPTACLKVDPAKLPLRSFVQLPCGGIGVDTDTYFNDACTQSAARLAVGYLTELCVQVWDNVLRNGYAIIRPPGHHAERDLAMGFCFFNNVAIAVKTLMLRPNPPRRVAIVDWDVHHGNGTQLAFETDDNVLYLSIHRHDNGNFFPGTGAVTDIGTNQGRGYSVNIALTGGVMGDPEYLAAWRVVMCPILTQFQPDLIVVSAGFDAAVGHPLALGGYRVTPQLFAFLTTHLCRFASGKVVLALEGGYDLTSICDSSEECVKSLCMASGSLNSNIDESQCLSTLSQEALLSPPSLPAQETLQKVVAVQKKYWTSLTGDGLHMNEVEWEGRSNGMAMGQLSIHSASPPHSADLSESRSPIRVDDSPAVK